MPNTKTLNAKEVDILKQGGEEWAKYKKAHVSWELNVTGQCFNEHDKICESDLSSINFQKCTFTNCIFNKSNLEFSNFSNCSINNCNFSGARVERCKIQSCREHKNTEFKGIFDTDFRGIIGKFSHLTSNDFRGNTSFEKVSLRDVQLQDSSFIGVDFRGTSFRRSDLTNTTWQSTIIDEHTEFELAYFESNHQIIHDKSDKIKLSFPLNWLNWKTARFIKTMALFNVSWIAVASSITILFLLSHFNQFTGASAELPFFVIMILINSSALLTGTLLFSWRCPEIVKDFTISEWVYSHKWPRQYYLSAIIRRPYSAIISLSLTLYGGGAVIYHLLDKVFSAMSSVLT